MKKDKSKLGVLSCILSLIPLVGVAFLFFGHSILNTDSELAQKAISVFLTITLLITPVAGLITGSIGLFQESKQLIFPIIGTCFNFNWIVFLVWAFPVQRTNDNSPSGMKIIEPAHGACHENAGRLGQSLCARKLTCNDGP